MDFEAIWTKYYPKLVVYYQRSFRLSTEDAEDLSQETLMNVFSRFETYDPGRPLSTWLYRIARNKGTDFIRKNSKRGDLLNLAAEIERVPDKNSAPPEKTFESAQLQKEISKFIETLQVEDRQIVFFKMYEELPYREIEKITGTPEGTIKYRIWAVRKKLEKYLKGKE